MGRRIAGSTLTIGLLVGACGGEPTEVGPIPSFAPIPQAALPGSAAAPVRLDAAGLAMDSVDVGALETLLDEAGFTGGTERSFTRARGGRRRLVARVLAFGDAGGAERYLAWLGRHAGELIGGAEVSADLRAPAGGIVFEHEPDPCCHNETRIFLAAWIRGSTVTTLEIGGQAARASDVPELIARLDAAV